MSECIICDKPTSGQFVKYCDECKPHYHPKKTKPKLNTSGKELRACKICGKVRMAEKRADYCKECYLKIARKRSIM